MEKKLTTPKHKDSKPSVSSSKRKGVSVMFIYTSPENKKFCARQAKRKKMKKGYSGFVDSLITNARLEAETQ